MALLRKSGKYLLLMVMAVIISGCSSATDKRKKKHYDTPKLVVGIVVDQMRYDYIYKYWDHYTDGGIKRLMNEGFSFDDAQYAYAPTYTGPGHASVYTGSMPAYHGIIGNSWFIKETGGSTNVVGDENVETVGSDSDNGKRSPHWLLSSTITDELRLSKNMQSKVVGVAIKDRGAILPAGYLGNAYWFDSKESKMISSTFYHEELPDWVVAFNDRSLPQEYVSKPWETLLPIEEYIESVEDDNRYEGRIRGEEAPVFPHDLPTLADSLGTDIFTSTPFGNTYTFEMAYAAIEGENLGQGKETDFLAISFSATDAVGHRYAPTSIEVQDTYLRFDREMEEFLKYLDTTFGKGNVLLFLTADHAGAHNTRYLQDLNMPTGTLNRKNIEEMLRDELRASYGFDPIRRVESMQIFLNNDVIRRNKVRPETVQKDVAALLTEVEGIAGALTSDAMQNNTFEDPIRSRMQLGFNVSRSGDVVYWTDPQWFSSSRNTGTTHGTPWSYDTRVPVIWYGWDVPRGRSVVPVTTSDIAPTLANFLNIPYTTGNAGKPLNDIIYRN